MPHVLIVDRNAERGATLRQRLAGVSGLHVASAREELATVHNLTRSSPDVVIQATEKGDSWMLSLLVAALPHTPILAYADKWEMAAEKRALESGARQLLSVTASREDFLAAILSVLRIAA